MKALSRHFNLNSLLIVAMGFLANYYLHDIQKSMDLVRNHHSRIAVIESQVDDLRERVTGVKPTKQQTEQIPE